MWRMRENDCYIYGFDGLDKEQRECNHVYNHRIVRDYDENRYHSCRVQLEKVHAIHAPVTVLPLVAHVAIE